jgi:ABC-type nitrate/sulfonate/bicarbonate transport system substrate-binding protein
LSFVVALGLCGCGGVASSGQGDGELTLLLGTKPEGVHAGIFLAVARGYDDAEGIELTIRRSGEARRLLRAGRIQAAILDAPLPGSTCVMAITQHPAGHFVCVSDTVPSEDVGALVRTLQRGYLEAEVDPESAVQAMLARAGGLDARALAEQLDTVSPSFEPGAGVIGCLCGRLPPGHYAHDYVRPVSRD